jgi:hypothetical protein
VTAAIVGAGLILGVPRRSSTKPSGVARARESPSAATSALVVASPQLGRRSSARDTLVAVDPDRPSGAGIPSVMDGARTPSVLLGRLGSSDPFVVLDAADGLAARKVTDAIPALAALDIRKSADSAPSIIDALGRLAAAADSTGRKTATERLLALLAQEKTRGAPESAANLLSIYEALGQTKDPAAAPALEAELRDRSVTLAARTVVVDALVRLGQPSSRAALTAARREAAATTTHDALEEEVRGEFVAQLDRAVNGFP